MISIINPAKIIPPPIVSKTISSLKLLALFDFFKKNEEVKKTNKKIAKINFIAILLSFSLSWLSPRKKLIK
jgi:hypothetical protein